MNAGKQIDFGTAKNLSLTPAPIHSDWVMEGRPLARNALLSQSEDGTACTLIWDCTAGLFNWHYDIDETVYILDGAVIVQDDNGVIRRLEAGDTAFFPAGSHAVWRVESYVRKIAFCRRLPHRSYMLAKQLYKTIMRGLGLRKTEAHSTPAMFGTAR